MDNKSVKLTLFALMIIIIGSMVVCMMGFPYGLLIILPGAIPHMINLCRWLKKAK